jgi:CBS domain-containing protein
MMLESVVGDVTTKKFFVVDTEDTLSFCQGIFREHHPRALVVLDKRKKYVGMLSERNMVRGSLDPSKTKVKAVYWKAPHVSPMERLGEAARLMVENDLEYLPAFEGGKVLGLVTDDAILKVLSRTAYGTKKVEEVMTKEPVTVDESDSIGKAVSRMRDQGISRLPVVSDGRVVGLVTLHDVVDEVYEPRARMSGKMEGGGEMVKPMKDPVSSMMSRPVVAASPRDTVAAAIDTMLARGISCLVVTGPGNRLLGMVTKTDLLRPLARVAVERPFVKLEISVKDRDGLDELDRERLASMLEAFARKHGKTLKDSVVSLYVKSHGGGRGGRGGAKLVHCRVMVSGPAGQFSAVGEGWGASRAIRESLDNLERRIIKTKEIAGTGRYSERTLDEALGLLG